MRQGRDELPEFKETRVDFELFKSEICHCVMRMGDLDFIAAALIKNDIREYERREWYPECLYLLAMVDYLSRINDIPLYNGYNDLRCKKLSRTIYPRSILALAAVHGDDKYLKESERESIPEFIRFNIVEAHIRDVA